jgi:hypothetical protein
LTGWVNIDGIVSPIKENGGVRASLRNVSLTQRLHAA